MSATVKPKRPAATERATPMAKLGRGENFSPVQALGVRKCWSARVRFRGFNGSLG